MPKTLYLVPPGGSAFVPAKWVYRATASGGWQEVGGLWVYRDGAWQPVYTSRVAQPLSVNITSLREEPGWSTDHTTRFRASWTYEAQDASLNALVTFYVDPGTGTFSPHAVLGSPPVSNGYADSDLFTLPANVVYQAFCVVQFKNGPRLEGSRQSNTITESWSVANGIPAPTDVHLFGQDPYGWGDDITFFATWSTAGVSADWQAHVSFWVEGETPFGQPTVTRVVPATDGYAPLNINYYVPLGCKWAYCAVRFAFSTATSATVYNDDGSAEFPTQVNQCNVT